MSSSNVDLINNLSITIKYIYKYILPIFYIVGNIGNLISLLIFSKRSWKKNVCVFYLKVYLLFSSLYINSTIIASILSQAFNSRAQNSNVVLCKLYIYCAYVFATISPSLLILASIDRLLISSQNVDTRLYSSKRLAYFSVTLNILFWVLYHSHLLFKVNLQEISRLVFICYFDPSKAYRDFMVYSLLIIKILFYLSMVILSMLAFKNVRHIRVIPRQQQRNQIRSMTKKDFQILRCLFAHDVVFMACGLWINIYGAYATVTKDQTKSTTDQAITSFTENFLNFIYNISYCFSFFIYAGISKAFRQEVKRMIYRIIGKNFVLSTREEENKQENIEINVVVLNPVQS